MKQWQFTKSILIICSLVSWVQIADSQPIDTEAVRAHVEFLASPELEGRLATEKGSEIAQEYIATHFRQCGLKPFDAAPDYYQSVPLSISHVDYDKTRIICGNAQDAEILKCNIDLFFFPRTGSDAETDAELVLAGYGIQAHEFEHDDYSNLEASGKILMVFDGEPSDSSGNSLLTGGKASKYSRAVVKARIAESAGAAALIIMQPPDDPLPVQKMVGRYMSQMNEPIIQLTENIDNFPVFYVSAAGAKKIMQDGIDLNFYKKSLERSEVIPVTDRIVRDLSIQIRFKDVQVKTTANIIGYIPGRIDEAVLIMAHHDHEGVKDGVVYPGADDNASGVAGLLETARALSELENPLRRSIIFLSTGAEEKGCLGAEYFVQHPLYPLENIVTVINLDEIGRDGSSQFRAMMDPAIPMDDDLLMIFYSGQTPTNADLAKQQNADIALNLMLEPVLQYHSASDHVAFHNQKIPCMFFFTGFHSDYTSPGDTPDKINYSKLARVSSLVYRLTLQLADANERPMFDTSITEVDRERKYGN